MGKNFLIGISFFSAACLGSIFIPYAADWARKRWGKVETDKAKEGRFFELSVDALVVLFCYIMGYFWSELMKS